MTVGHSAPTAVETQANIQKLRSIALAIREHCVACLLSEGKASDRTMVKYGTRTHAVHCYNKACLKCLSVSHFSRNCIGVIEARRNTCGICGLRSVDGTYVHHFARTSQNEFGSSERCIFSRLTTLAVACLRNDRTRDEFVRSGIVPQEVVDFGFKATVKWLGTDTSTSQPGIIEISDALVAKFGVDVHKIES